MLQFVPSEHSNMPPLDIDEETIERLDSLRVDDESYDEISTELSNSYEAEESTLSVQGTDCYLLRAALSQMSSHRPSSFRYAWSSVVYSSTSAVAASSWSASCPSLVSLPPGR